MTVARGHHDSCRTGRSADCGTWNPGAPISRVRRASQRTTRPPVNPRVGREERATVVVGEVR